MKWRKRLRRVVSRISASRAIKRHKSVAPSKPETKEQSRDAVTVGVLSQEILDNNCAAAKRYGVEPAVHAADFIYWFHVAHPVHEFVVVPIRLYFDEGAKSAHKLVAIIDSQGLRGEEKVRLLEFASGYGRLSRHLKQYPHIDLVCADIHNDAIEFLVNTIGVKAFISNSQPEEFLYEEKFDVTFALSFFTHMPKVSFGHWLGALYKTLNPGGRLIFTTSGYGILPEVPGVEIPPDGFLFMEVSEQKDLDVREYGSTIVKPEYVIAQIIENTHSDHIVWRQSNWDQRQDLWIVHRT